MQDNIPAMPKKAQRVTIELDWPENRLDNILLEKMRMDENVKLNTISRGGLKKLFLAGKVQIKGQNAKPSSALAKGTTYIDLLI